MLMSDKGFEIEPVNTPPNGTAILYTIGVFLVVALLAMFAWFWYAGHHALSATPREGPTGVGGMTAGSKGGAKH
jgi:hypothetical protein